MNKFNHPNSVKWFTDLVTVDSETFGETAVAEFIEKKVKEKGYNAKVIREVIDLTQVPENIRARNPKAKWEGTTENVFVVFEGNDSTKPTIFFAAHTDTVANGKGVKPVFADGLIKSDGTTVLGADDKAGLAEAFAGMELVIEQGIKHGTVVIAGFAMEEIGLVGSKMSKVINELGVKYGYVLDMNDRIGKIVSRTMHTQFFTIDMVYDAPKMHGGGPYGENMITYAAELVRMLPRGAFSSESFASSGVNGLTFDKEEGSMQMTKAQIKGNYSSIFSQEMGLLKTIIQKMVENHKRDRLSLTVKFTPEKTLGYCIYDTEVGTQIVKKAEKAITEMGLTFDEDKSRGGFDANELTLKDIPTLVLSCGFMKNHTNEEFIVEQDLHDGAELVKRLIADA